jgi:hypothetical protein
MSTNATKFGSVPIPEPERDAVCDQLERILKSPFFLHSKHYQDFLRYVVETTLEGHAETLKERTVGVDVFGRNVLYDTNVDNIVRNTSTRVRKRLAQYYQEKEHAGEFRIALPPGTYVPVFSPPAEKARPLAPAPESRKWILRYCPFFIALILIAAVLGWYYLWSETAIHRFWKPALNLPGSVTICVGAVGRSWPQLMSETEGTAPFIAANPDSTTSTNLSFEDATALARLSAFLMANGKAYEVRKDAFTTLSDLTRGPTVLIGAFNNQWTLRFTSQLRFTFQKDFAAHLLWIRDQQNPSMKNWISDDTLPVDKITVDYGIISRLFDSTTRRFVVVAAGLREFGSAAASMLLTDPSQIQSFSDQAPAGWQRKNLQLVFVARVVDGVPGAPKVIAMHTW